MHSSEIEQYIRLAVGSYTIKGPGALYTVDYAQSIGATHIIRGIRGIRNNSDFDTNLR